MGEWSKVESLWLENPGEHEVHVGPLRDRGEKLMRSWLDRAWGGGECTKLQIGVGFELDPDTNEHRGAMLSITFDEDEPIFMRPHEITYVISFLKHFYDTSDEEFVKGEYRDDLDGFLSALEGGLKEAEHFIKGARRN